MKRVLSFLVLSLVWLACSSDESRSRLEVRLTDSPGDYEEVNIEGVEIHRSTGTQNSGWVSLDVNSGVYNILTLANGLDTLLGAADLPSGRISQIRLILGTNNTLKINGEMKPLETPSGQQSGLKVNVQAQLTPGVTYVITLDFDAARSIVFKGSGTYSLKPVIRALTEATSGAIEGHVVPVESMPAVFALDGADTVASAYTDSLGFFLLRAVPPGTYTVTFDPKPGFTPGEVDGVVVTLGNVTDLGEVQIN
jgi:Domain of unknown function (DUF4382)/Carboxypeptidase regulatory-like domain